MKTTILSLGLLLTGCQLFGNTPLGTSLLALRRGEAKAQEDVKPGSPMDRLVWDSNTLNSGDWRQGLLVGEWLFRAHLLRQKLGIADPPAQNLLERAWLQLSRTYQGIRGNGITTGRSTDLQRVLPGEAKASDGQTEILHLLLLEVATRLEAPEKMKFAQTVFAEHVGWNTRANPEPRTRFLAMKAALHAGDWAFAERMAGELGNPMAFDQLHAQAESSPNLPDYTAALAWANSAKPKPGSPSLPKAAFRIKAFRIRPEGRDWVAQENPTNPLFQSGALAHWLRVAPTPLAVAGAFEGDRLSLLGYRNDETGRVTEQFELKRETSGTWKGTRTLQPAQGTAVREEVELELESLPSR